MSQCCCGVIMLLVYMVQTAATTAIKESQKFNCPFEENLKGICLMYFWLQSCLTGHGATIHFPDCFVEPIEVWQNYLSLSIIFVASVTLACVGFIFGQRHFQNQERLGKAIAVYDIRTSQCASEDDRALLLRFVNDIFDPSASLIDENSAPGNRSIGDRGSAPAVDSNTADHANDLAPSRASAEHGLDAFNQAVRTTVPRHVSVSGIRRFKILPYIVAVLVPLQFYETSRREQIFRDPFYMFDRWAFSYRTLFEGSGLDYQHTIPLQMIGWSRGTGNSFRYAMAFAFDRFILIPFGAYLFGVLVMFFMYLQQLLTKYTGLRYWITVSLLLPPFVVLECVCCFRPQIIDMIRYVTSMGCMQGETLLTGVYQIGMDPAPPKYVPDFSSLRGLYALLYVTNAADMGDIFQNIFLDYSKNDLVPDNSENVYFTPTDYHVYPITPSTAVDVCLWIFLVVPIFFFTIYIYEPVWLRELRLDALGRFKLWLRAKRSASKVRLSQE